MVHKKYRAECELHGWHGDWHRYEDHAALDGNEHEEEQDGCDGVEIRERWGLR